jgi:predicted transcriptional regulator of viral defense system
VSPTRPAELAAALAATQHGHITAQQCRDCGLSPSTVRRLITRGALESTGPGVYRVVGAPRTWHGRALAAVLAAGPDALASHRTAATSGASRASARPGASR